MVAHLGYLLTVEMAAAEVMAMETLLMALWDLMVWRELAMG